MSKLRTILRKLLGLDRTLELTEREYCQLVAQTRPRDAAGRFAKARAS